MSEQVRPWIDYQGVKKTRVRGRSLLTRCGISGDDDLFSQREPSQMEAMRMICDAAATALDRGMLPSTMTITMSKYLGGNTYTTPPYDPLTIHGPTVNRAEVVGILESDYLEHKATKEKENA